ncbi:transcription cofactor vestigial-like protein 2 isoform X2 [Ptychodera flava]|uniref:transcription cofactor vestigial-like protein 2 isoform X2 n=1 Tax=Ptychodera flava TaxID=63121 RepID=UPI00396A6A6F
MTTTAMLDKPSRHFTNFEKFGHYKMHEPLDPVEYSGTVLTQHQPLPPPPVPVPQPPPAAQDQSSSRTKSKNDEESDSDKEATPEAEYISSRCVLFSYFTGDIGKHVDDHFSRALSQPSSFSADSQKNSTSTQWKTGEFSTSPMSQRNFPPSFWNSSYNHHSTSYPQSSLSGTHHDTIAFRDPYTSAYSTSYSSIHQSDPWHYSLSTQGSYTAHRSMHDLGYNMASSSPFNPRYSSLLIQPSVRSGRLGGQCDLSKPGESWTSRYGEHSQLTSDAHSVSGLNVEASATATLDHQEPASKDLYWF